MYIRRVFYITVVCDVLEPEEIGIEQVLGIDLGLVNLAVDSGGTTYSGSTIDAKRQRFARRRQELQQHGTRAARGKWRLLQGKQARFQQDVNHTIAKRIVETAQRSASAGAGVSLPPWPHPYPRAARQAPP